MAQTWALERAWRAWPVAGRSPTVDSRLMNDRVRFAVVFVVVNLHTLRRFSEALYLVVYAAVAAMAVNDSLRGARKGRLTESTSGIIIWVGVAAVGLATSLVIISTGAAVTGMARFLFASPVFFAFLAYTPSAAVLRQHISFMVSFFAIASLSIPLQLVTGPIDWFADASTRGGLDRFGTLLGSMLSVAGSFASYLILTQVKSPRSRWLWIAIMIVTALMSLSKVVIGGVAMGMIGLAILNRRHLTRFALGSITAGGIVLGVVANVPPAYESFRVVLAGYGIVIGDVKVYDATVTESALDRLTQLPLENFGALAQFDTPLVYVTGAGYGMGGRALVPGLDPIAPQAHNQYGEILTVFGPVGAILLISVLVGAGQRLWRRFRASDDEVYLMTLLALGVVAVSSTFANGGFYHPASSSLIYLALFTAVSARIVGTSPPRQAPVSDDRASPTL